MASESSKATEGIPGTKRGVLFIVAVCAVFLQAGLWSARRTTREIFPDNSLLSKAPRLVTFMKGDAKPSIKEHPIPRLMAEAESKFRNLLSSQSSTLAQAVAEYKKRFNRDPPKGFDEWWKFIQDNDVLMVDEYNAITEDLEPFWDLPPTEFRLRASLVRPMHCSFCETMAQSIGESRLAIYLQSTWSKSGMEKVRL